MENRRPHITVFEYQALKIGQKYNEVLFTEKHRLSLENFYGSKGVPFYTLIQNGVSFNKYVGAIQVKNLLIEVLPKADKYEDKDDWRKILINMLRAVGAFNIHAPSSSSLKIKSNFILDLYFELLVKEVEYLFNKGFIKKYRKTEGNTLALKGNILFNKHIQQNIIHQERFYVKHTTYDNEHLLHQILYKTLLLLKQINTNVALNSRIGSLLLNFPELKDVKVAEATFNKIIYNRKTEEYRNSISISRLLLLKYHPDLSNGQNDVLALMFDMNMLWEKFIYVSLRKYLKPNMTISAQSSKYFWQSMDVNNSSIKPDIVINKEKANTVVIDTKWKNIGDKNPSPEDLRQLYVYHDYYEADKVALVYPGQAKIGKGNYFEIDNKGLSDKECAVITVPTDKTITAWQKNIACQIYQRWIDGASKCN